MPLWSKLWSAKFGFLKIKHKMRKTSHFTVKYTKIPHFFKCGIGGGRWIRTTEGSASRFTVCPLWPLGNSPILTSLVFDAVELVDGLEPPTC